MQKYNYTDFLVSDIHSFYTPLRACLKEAGFNPKDKTHRLIILGDIFDRGSGTLEVYKFIKSLPKHRRILIKGNHEQLYFELLEKTFPDEYDFSNGTVKTFCHIAGIDPDELNIKLLAKTYYAQQETPPREYLRKKVEYIWAQVKALVEVHEITAWLRSNEWIDYYEYNNLICVHSFIPIVLSSTRDWREAHASEWDDARWGCPWKLFNTGLFNKEIINNNILVCGHWHAQEFHEVYERVSNNWELYFGKNLIALDGCCALTMKIPVLKVTSEGFFDRFGNKLEVPEND